MNKKFFGFVFTFVLISTGLFASNFVNIANAVTQTTITSFSPEKGEVGKTVVITGTNLDSFKDVVFGSIPSDNSSLTDSKITTEVPVGAVTGKIKIRMADGSEVISTKDFEVVSSSNTTKVPTITSISPETGKVGDEITIIGNYLTLSSLDDIYFGLISSKAKTNENDQATGATKITVLVPKDAITAKIILNTIYGAVTSANDFTVLSADGTKAEPQPPVVEPDATINGKKVTFSGLVPNCNTGTVDPKTGEFPNPCNFDYFMALLNKVIKFLLFTIATPLVALIIMYTGWLFISAGGSAGQTEKAKHILFNVVIGYVVALIAWLLINAILSIFNITDPLITSFLKK